MKAALQEELLSLETMEEVQVLDLTQLHRKMWVQKRILEILEEEELYWFRRSHQNWLLKGDNNTDFFHRVANGRERKNTILSFLDGDNLIEGDSNLVKHAIDFYKTLFGPAPGNMLPLNGDLWDNGEKVDVLDNEELTKHFSEEEIKNALFQMEKNKAAGPDKIPIEFYQHCWEIIKEDILEMFGDFILGN